MNNLHTLLHTLKHGYHGILPQYAAALRDKLEAYIAGIATPPVATTSKLTIPVIINGVAVISINGIIAKRVGLPKEILDWFGIVDLDNVDAELKAAQSNPDVATVVLSVSSPGGYLTGVQTTGNLIAEIAKEKEVIAYSDVLNASAAYWLSSQANTIIASADAEFGSVGVYTENWDYSKALENEGVKVTVIKAGTLKAMGHPSQPLSDEDKAYIQAEINETYELFKATVNSKRTIADADLQGQCFSGQKLLDKGFIDGFASDLQTLLGVLQK